MALSMALIRGAAQSYPSAERWAFLSRPRAERPLGAADFAGVAEFHTGQPFFPPRWSAQGIGMAGEGGKALAFAGRGGMRLVMHWPGAGPVASGLTNFG